MRLPFEPPLEPMLAKASDDLPSGDGWLYEPKWDGFRAIVFRDGDEVYTQSRDLKPLDRYFPELAAPAADKFPAYHRHMLALHQRRYATIAGAHEAGIPIYLGTDAGGALAHGLAAGEALELQRAGLSPLDVLEAGTWGARAWLGHAGIGEGDPADLLVLDADPRADLAVLGSPQSIVLRGNRVR